MQTPQSMNTAAFGGVRWLLAVSMIAMVVSAIVLVVQPRGFAGVSAAAGAKPTVSFPDFASIAEAAVVSQTGGLTVMTTEVAGEDILLVLDSRNEELFVYRADSKVGVQLLQRYPVPQLFVDARARTRGGGP